MDKERSDLFRDFYHSCNRHVDSGIFTFSTFLTTSILENRCIFIICSHYPRDEMFFLSCSRHPSRKFTLVQEWNRPYPMCTYRISNFITFRRLWQSRNQYNPFDENETNDANHQRDYLSKYKTYNFFQFYLLYSRKRIINGEKLFFVRFHW